MTYPEDVLEAAREAAAEVADRLGKHADLPTLIGMMEIAKGLFTSRRDG